MKQARKIDKPRHPLNVQPMDLFGKPFGNGYDIPDLSDEEMAEWQRQNGDLFLERLPLWKRMAPKIGDRAAADILKGANDWKQIHQQYDAWKRGDPLPYLVGIRRIKATTGAQT